MRLLLRVCFFLLYFTLQASSVKTCGVVLNHYFPLLSAVVVGSHGTSKWTQSSLVNKRRRGRAAAVLLLAVWQRLNQAGRGSYLTERTGRCTAKWLLRLTLSLPYGAAAEDCTLLSLLASCCRQDAFQSELTLTHLSQVVSARQWHTCSSLYNSGLARALANTWCWTHDDTTHHGVTAFRTRVAAVAVTFTWRRVINVNNRKSWADCTRYGNTVSSDCCFLSWGSS